MILYPHPYRATFYGTCSRCGRPRSSAFHDMEQKEELTCPFCGERISALTPIVADHLRERHRIVVHACGGDGSWTQEGLNEWKRLAREHGWRIGDEGEEEG